jgi:uncharacterized integral membrane protein
MSEPNPDIITVRQRAIYTKDYTSPLFFLMMGLLLLIIGLGAFIAVQLNTRIEPQYFPLTANMQIIEPIPLDQEGITKPQLLNWINEAITVAYSFNYSNMGRQASRVRPYFGDNAYQVYLDMLRLDEDFATVVSKFYVVSVRATGTPEILTSKAFKGRYAWQIRVPAVITFSNALYLNTQNVEFEFLVWRVPETEVPIGITIASFSRQVVGRSGIRPVGGL